MKLFKIMKKYMVILPFSAMVMCVAIPTGATAQVAVLEVIKAGIKRVIKAVDLKVQRMQNRTVWLQNAQKTLENQLSKLRLGDIADWTEKQRKLYEDYYQELWKVKSAITYIKRIKELSQEQGQLVKEYQWAWERFSKDLNFTPDELENMTSVYSGLLEESIKNIDEILMVVHSFDTQMSDGERLEIIERARDKIHENLSSLRKFNASNIQLSMQRAKDMNEIQNLKKIYEIEN
ncbi:MAG: conjugal transfer protein TraI [Sphingobacterium sp.]|jgi:RPA family protein|nr:conjugal transfer protein TraI [Sphingobacterium sp.]